MQPAAVANAGKGEGEPNVTAHQLPIQSPISNVQCPILARSPFKLKLSLAKEENPTYSSTVVGGALWSTTASALVHQQSDPTRIVSSILISTGVRDYHSALLFHQPSTKVSCYSWKSCMRTLQQTRRDYARPTGGKEGRSRAHETWKQAPPPATESRRHGISRLSIRPVTTMGPRGPLTVRLTSFRNQQKPRFPTGRLGDQSNRFWRVHPQSGRLMGTKEWGGFSPSLFTTRELHRKKKRNSVSRR